MFSKVSQIICPTVVLLSLTTSAHAQDITVRVTKGQTLYDLARTYYGNGMRWPVICEANLDILQDCALLEVGDVLTVPSPTQSATQTSSSIAQTIGNMEASAHETTAQVALQPDADALEISSDPSVDNLATGAEATTDEQFWVASAEENGLIITRIAAGVTEDGLSYADYRVQGAPSASFASKFYRTEFSLTQASEGQTFQASGYFQALAGDTTAIGGLGLLIAEQINGEFKGFKLTPNSKNAIDLRPVSVEHTVEVEGANEVRVAVVLTGLVEGRTVNYTFRVAGVRFVAVQ